MSLFKRAIIGALIAFAALFGAASAASADIFVSPCDDDDLGAYGEVDGHYFRVCVDR